MDALAAIIARLVACTSATATQVFASNAARLPSGDVPFLTVVETGGVTPVGTHNDGPTAYRQPGYQVVARATAYQAARALAQEAYDAMTATNVVLSGVPFLALRPMQEPFELPLDSSNRARVAFNVRASHAT